MSLAVDASNGTVFIAYACQTSKVVFGKSRIFLQADFVLLMF